MFYILKETENKSTLQISKELGRKYDSVLAFVREVQEIAEKIEGGNKFERPRRDRRDLYYGGEERNQAG